MRDDSLEMVRNLGPRISARLARAGIRSRRQLRTVGAVNAYRRTLIAGAHPDLDLLWALQAAVEGRDRRQISDAEKTRLLMELRHLHGPPSTF